MMSGLPDFSAIGFDAPVEGSSSALADWKALVGARGNQSWRTPEGIDVKPVYTAEDLDPVTHLDTMPGLPPFLRGPYSTMYVRRPWTIRSTQPRRGSEGPFDCVRSRDTPGIRF
jgi:methylmalonyl-CoA mutase